ncbi:MAG: hypothetical protein ACFCVD_11305 [Nodosilinea sp.]
MTISELLIGLYGLMALVVLTLAIRPIWQDPANPKMRPETWLWLGLAMALGPMTLPNMIVHRLKQHPQPRSAGRYLKVTTRRTWRIMRPFLCH